MSKDHGKESAVEHRLQSLDDAVGEILRQVGAKKRDKWDLAAMASQFISAAVLGVATLAVSYYAQVHLGAIGVSNSQAQVEVARQNRTLEFLKTIADAHSDPSKRVALISTAALAIPEQVTLVARYYAIADESDSVRGAAIKVLGQQQAKSDLQYIVAGGRLPDADLAKTQLGQAVKAVRLRISQVDDLGSASLNGQEVLRVTTGQDSGWQDIADKFKIGTNDITLRLANGPLGGYSVRFQLIAGGHSYDSGVISKEACPCNAPVLEIHLQVVLAGDLTVSQIKGSPPVYF